LINGKTIHLKPFGIEDADFLLHWNNDPDYTGEFEPFEPVSRVELEDWLLRDRRINYGISLRTRWARRWGRLLEGIKGMAQYR